MVDDKQLKELVLGTMGYVFCLQEEAFIILVHIWGLFSITSYPNSIILLF